MIDAQGSTVTVTGQSKKSGGLSGKIIYLDKKQVSPLILYRKAKI